MTKIKLSACEHAAVAKLTQEWKEGYSGCEIARIIGIHNAHVYRAFKGDFTPTYVETLRAQGYIPPRPPYKYFKIRRDDPRIAAEQIVRNLGQMYAVELQNALLDECLSCFGVYNAPELNDCPQDSINDSTS